MIKLETKDSQIMTVKPKNRRTIKGSMDVKSILYMELNEKIKKLDMLNLSVEEKTKLLEKREDINHMSVKMTSFLPYEYLHELSDVQNQVKTLYRSSCITDDCQYMTMANWEKMKEELMPIIEKCNGILDDITAHWDYVLESAAKRLFNVSDNKITMEEAEAIIQRKVKSAKIFRQSYENAFCYTVAPLDDNLKFVNVGKDEEQAGDEFYLNEMESILKKQLLEIVTTLDTLLHNKELSKYDFGEKPKQMRPRRSLNACKKILDRFTAAFKDKELIALSKKIADIVELDSDEDYILYEEAEYLCMDVIAKLYESKLLAADEYPEDLKFMTKSKYDGMKKQADMYADNQQLREVILATA